MSRTSVLVILAALCACKAKLEWNEKAITRIDEGPFAFSVPGGIRDTTESKDFGLAHIARRADKTAHILVREDDSNADSSISFMWTDTSSKVTCDTLQIGLEAAGGTYDRDATRSEKIRNDTTCMFKGSDDDSDVTTWIRVHGDHMLTLACIRPKKGDRNLDQWCERYVAELRAQ